MSTFTVSIGRNIDGEPMPRERWIKFQARVEGTIQDLHDVTVFFAGRGGGIWEGRYEEAATWVFGWSESLGLPGEWKRFLDDLAYWADQYDQDAIAVTTGSTRFVEAKGKPARRTA
jgi:hypothetical protein